MTASRPSLWEWRAELEHGRSLTTGKPWRGHRVTYRRQGERRWRSFLLSTDDHAAPTESVVLRAIELHAGVRPGGAA